MPAVPSIHRFVLEPLEPRVLLSASDVLPLADSPGAANSGSAPEEVLEEPAGQWPSGEGTSQFSSESLPDLFEGVTPSGSGDGDGDSSSRADALTSSVESQGTLTVTDAADKDLGQVMENAGTELDEGSTWRFETAEAVAGSEQDLPESVLKALEEGDIIAASAASHLIENAGTFIRAGPDTALTGDTGTVYGTPTVTADDPISVSHAKGTLYRVASIPVTWDGGGDGSSWSDARNWSNDTLPTEADDVIINMAGTPTVTHASSSTSIRSLLCTEAFVLSGGSLSVAETAQFNGAVTLRGGTLDSSGTVRFAGPVDWSYGTMKGIAGR